MPNKGAFTIAIEGSDGAGKETQTDLLFKFLEGKGYKVDRVSFPRYNKTLGGTLLWEVLKSERSHKYEFSKVDPKVASKLYAMDREESLPYLRNLIKKNDIVIFDRYVESNLLHQGGKFRTAKDRLAFADWLYRLEYHDIGLPHPNEIVYLALPFWLSRKRAQLRAQKTGGKLDAVERDIKYVKAGHQAGIFYAQHFGWNVIECFQPALKGIRKKKELSAEEVSQAIIAVLGYAGQKYTDSIP